MTTTDTLPAAPVRRAALAAVLGAVALGLAACASLAPQTPEDAVIERAQQRWDALIAGDFDRAWTFTPPGYRALVTQRDYHKNFGSGGRWKGVQIHGATCQAERCTVKLRITSEVLIPQFKGKELTGHTQETWVREDGEWWYHQRL